MKTALIVSTAMCSSMVFGLPCRAQEVALSGIPISFTLPRAGYTTLVVEDANGRRVRNLIGETYLPAGLNRVIWDGCDEGQWVGLHQDGQGDVMRHRVAAGAYHVRGLWHERIVPRYQFSVNSPGNPPWKTKDGSGAWLADHSPAADILYLPQGVPVANGTARFVVCSSAGESGEAFVWLNKDGKRLYGMNTGFWGGTHLARDPGPKPIADIYAYTFISGERDFDNNNLEVRAFKRDGSIERVVNTTFDIELKKSRLPTFKTFGQAYGTNGLAVYNGLVVFAFTRENKLVFADARQKKIIGEAPIIAPRGLCFDAEGRLYVVSGQQIKRFHVGPKGTLSGAQTLIATGLQEPHRVAIGAAGELLVADWGRSHQVKIFTTEGKLIRVIGRAGGPQLGRYDEQRMSFPSGMATDSAGRLWVTEAEAAPKRISLWNARNGAFTRAFYGPPQYGGGGKLDPRDASRLYYDSDWGQAGVTFGLDWKNSAGKPMAIYWRSKQPNVEIMPGVVPETALYRNGFRYLVNSYNDTLRYNQDRGVGMWRLDKDEIARPVMIVGNGADLVNQTWGWAMRQREQIAALWKNLDPATVLFIWCDANGDQVAQTSEIQFRQVKSPLGGESLRDVGLGVLVQPDLSLMTTWGVTIAPPRIDARGLPHYDLQKLSFLGDKSSYSERFIAGQDTVNTRIGDHDLSLAGARRDGSHAWRYLETNGGQEVPGALVQPNRLLGLPVVPRSGQAGPIFAINGEKGAIFLFTSDGLFLQTLGGDMRHTPLWRDPALFRREAAIDHISFEDEHFHPTLAQVADGSIYLVAGKEHSSLLRLDGLDSVHRLDVGTIQVAQSTLSVLPATQTIAARKSERRTLNLHLRDTAPLVDGDLSDWPADTDWAAIDARTSAALSVANNTLYVAFRSDDANLVSSAGGDFRYAFKRGGALDVMIGTDPNAPRNRQTPVAGDLRLLVTRSQNQTRAVLYRAAAPDATATQQVVFDSPIGRAPFDQVIDVSQQVTLASREGNYEFSIPLDALGLAAKAGQEILGDVGILRGDGAQTTQRLYWNNLNTDIVSDIPSEARLQPGNWGLWTFAP